MPLGNHDKMSSVAKSDRRVGQEAVSVARNEGSDRSPGYSPLKSEGSVAQRAQVVPTYAPNANCQLHQVTSTGSTNGQVGMEAHPFSSGAIFCRGFSRLACPPKSSAV